jgi:HK97 family phage major capsid protein
MDLKQRVSELQAKFRAAEDAGKALSGRAKAEKRDLTDEELVELEKAGDRMLAARCAIDECRHQMKELGRDGPGFIDPSGLVSVDGGLPELFAPLAGKTEGVPGHAAWREIMGRGPAQDSDFGSMREFQRAVEMKDPRLFGRRDVQGSASESVPAGGGFVIPSAFEATILDNALPAEIIRPRCRVFGIEKGETLRIPAYDNGDRSSTVYGGMTWQWVKESGTITPTDPSFKRLEMTVNKLIIDGKTSSELQEDAAATYSANPLEAMLSKVVGYALDSEFLRGTGAGRPLGILNSPALITVSKVAGQTADTVKYENLCAMFARSLNPLNSVWIANPTCMPTLLTLSQVAGTGGVPVPVMGGSGGAFNILTRPVLFSEHLPVVGDLGDIIFADLSMYGVLIRGGMTLMTSTAAYWSTDEVGIRLRMRVDGQPLIDAPVQPRLGATLSPFVTLEART